MKKHALKALIECKEDLGYVISDELLENILNVEIQFQFEANRSEAIDQIQKVLNKHKSEDTTS